MKAILILLMFSGSLVDAVKISFMPRRILILYCILWGVIGGISTILVSEMTRDSFWEKFNMEDYIIFQWLELAIVSLYLFNSNFLGLKKVLKAYPGLMIIFSIFVLTYYILTFFPGYNFKSMAFINGAVIFLVLTATTLLFKYLGISKNFLYIVCLFCGVLNIISLGIS